MLNRLLARAYDPLLAGAERRGLGALRADLLRDLDGTVVVVGAGTGADLPHLPAAVTRVVAVEPSGPMREQLAAGLAPADAARTEVVRGFAEELPLDDGEADHAVLSLVLCSVRDPQRAVDELHRVLRHGGTVRVLEHGVAASAVGRTVQRVANPAWRAVSGGCNLDRDHAALLARRFEVDQLRAVDVPVVSRIGRVVAGTVVR